MHGIAENRGKNRSAEYVLLSKSTGAALCPWLRSLRLKALAEAAAATAAAARPPGVALPPARGPRASMCKQREEGALQRVYDVRRFENGGGLQRQNI